MVSLRHCIYLLCLKTVTVLRELPSSQRLLLTSSPLQIQIPIHDLAVVIEPTIERPPPKTNT